MEQGTGKERYTPMGQEAEFEIYQVDMEKIYRQLDAEDKVIEYLAGEIAKERKKPGFLQDQARIDKCLDMIAKLKNHKTEYSQEELKAKADALLAKARAKEAAETAAAPAPIRRYRLRPVLVAVILLVVVCLCGATACGVIPSLRMWFAKIVNNPGASVEDNGITYSYNGQAVIYKDIHELLEKEQLDILYPSKLPDGVELKNVQRIVGDGTEKIFLVLDPKDVNYVIIPNFAQDIEINPTATEHKTNFISAQYWEDDMLCQYTSVFIHEGSYYSITSRDLNSLLLILDNIRKP